MEKGLLDLIKDSDVKVYFGGCSGIENPVDYDGKPIKEGDILTHCWFDDSSDFLEKYPQTEEQLMKPVYEVKKHKSGNGLFGEGIEVNKTLDSRLYLHDFRFKETKNLTI